MRSGSSRRGWGFKIDYAQAVTDDDSRIAWALRSIEHGLYKIARGERGARIDVVSLIDLVATDPQVFYRLGYTPQDLANLSGEMDLDIWQLHPDLPDVRHSREDRARIDEIFRDMADRFLFRDEAEARAELRRAKASRARHVRNQEKHDRDLRVSGGLAVRR